LRPMTNGRDLDRNPRTGVPFFSMLMVDVVLLSEILIKRGMTGHSRCGIIGRVKIKNLARLPVR
jgi:hypothetical protein